ncbi:MAG: DUF2239 family protein [Myxococcales bacterium]
MTEAEETFSAFVGERLLASGELRKVLLKAKQRFDAGEPHDLLIFDDQTGQQVEFDLRGPAEQMLERELPAPRATGPGRPKLGVVSREVSLLPRHWDWLEQEPNGISAALRRLVEEASKRDPGEQRARKTRAAASRFMTALAGNLPNYEEASRALFAGDQPQFEAHIKGWPKDIRKKLEELTRQR